MPIAHGLKGLNRPFSAAAGFHREGWRVLQRSGEKLLRFAATGPFPTLQLYCARTWRMYDNHPASGLVRQDSNLRDVIGP